MKMRLIKARIFAAGLSAALLFSALPVSLARAEEGMFMLDKIATLPLTSRGLKISSTEIYNSAGGGLSEAVARVNIGEGGGGTGEFVSANGLLLTNHHVAFDGLVAASNPQNNYGENGFKANSIAEELPAKNYSLTLTLKEEDVTAQVLNGVNANDSAAITKRIEELIKAEQAQVGPDITVTIQPLNNNLFYYKFNTMQIRDVRIAYAPPKNIGFYGGDPDNFEWTRHAGDFTFMRAYVGKDGRPAEYSKDNVPFKPKRFLTISLDGVKEDDFTMIIGYPANTTRYRESYSVAFNQDIRLPFLVDYLKANVEAFEMVARNNPAKRIALQGDIFSYNNSIKAFEGGVVAMRRANIVGQKQADEARFQEWLRQDPARTAKYGEALPGLKVAYDDYLKTARRDYVLQYMLSVPPVNFLFAALSGQANKEELKKEISTILRSEPVANREVLKFFLREAAELPAEQRLAAIERRFGNLGAEARLQAEDEFARRALESSALTTESGLNNLVNLSIEQMRSSNEPLVAFIAEIGPIVPEVFATQQKFNAAVSRYRLPYIQGIIEMKSITPYPDANFTQRFSYGSVKGYQPKEAVAYSPFTTLNGVFEKDTGREPFNAPAKLRELWQQKDFGRYAVGNSVPLDFLTTNDIIGGNSGSPVLNGNGEQVGIAFDGNYEGLGNDFFFSDALGRTIVVDMRYVLFVTEKFGEANWILRELNIKNANAKSAATVN